MRKTLFFLVFLRWRLAICLGPWILVPGDDFKATSPRNPHTKWFQKLPQGPGDRFNIKTQVLTDTKYKTGHKIQEISFKRTWNDAQIIVKCWCLYKMMQKSMKITKVFIDDLNAAPGTLGSPQVTPGEPWGLLGFPGGAQEIRISKTWRPMFKQFTLLA